MSTINQSAPKFSPGQVVFLTDPDPCFDRQTVYFVDSIFGGHFIIQEHEIDQLATARLNPINLIQKEPCLPLI